MRLKNLLTVLILFLKLPGFSQTDSSAYQKFLADFLNDYKELSQPPIYNYYDVLSNTGKLTFTLNNPLFKEAILDVANSSKTEEMDPINLLFDKVYSDLRNNFVWMSMKDVYVKWDSVFALYNNYLCPCLSSKVSDTDRIEKMDAPIQDCMANLSNDSTLRNAVKAKMGGKNSMELDRDKNYFVAYLYQNCEVARHQWNNAILNTIFGQYYADISDRKKNEAESAIIFFKDKKYDSLSLLFPKYKRFTAAFTEITANLKRNGVTFISNMSTNDKKSNVVITFLLDQAAIGDATVTNSSNSIDSKIIAIEYKSIAGLDEQRLRFDFQFGFCVNFG